MGLVVQHNLPAIGAYNKMNINVANGQKSTEKLSSGFRINRAGDDAAGLAISEKMRGQIRGLDQATRNAQDGISLIQTAEGALNETHSILQRMRELSVQSANGTYDDANDRMNINKEVDALKSEIDRIAKSTEFNGTKLLDGTLGGYAVTGSDIGNIAGITVKGGNAGGEKIELAGATAAGKIAITKPSDMEGDFTEISSADGVTSYRYTAKADSTKAEIDKWDGVEITVIAKKDADGAYVTDAAGELELGAAGKGVTFQIGANGVEDQKVTLSVANQNSSTLGVAAISVATQDGANSAIDSIDKAINSVSSTRADLGALQNRLEHTVNNLTTTSENLTAAESRIRDTDMAKEMMAFTKNNILQQAAQAMLAQANTQPQAVLQLLQ